MAIFLKSMLLSNFTIRWCLIFLIIYWIFRWYWNRYYSMILIRCYYPVSLKVFILKISDSNKITTTTFTTTTTITNLVALGTSLTPTVLVFIDNCHQNNWIAKFVGIVDVIRIFKIFEVVRIINYCWKSWTVLKT